MARDDPSLELQDPAANVEGSNRRSRRLFRRLCLLLLVMIVVPMVIIGYRYQQQMEFIERCGPAVYFSINNVHTTPWGPEWVRDKVGEGRMRGFDQIVSIEELSEATARDLKYLSQHPLRELHLVKSNLTSSVIESLSDLQDLKLLELARCSPMSDSLLREISKLKHLENLQFTDDPWTEPPRSLMDELLGTDPLAPLENRIPFDSSLTPRSLLALHKLTHLKSLTFRGMDLTNDYLIEVGQLSNLESLDLSNTAITDAGLLHLAKLPNLRELYLSKTSVTDDGIKLLDGCSSLQKLELLETSLTDDGIKWLEMHLPDCTLWIQSESTLELIIRQ